MQLEETQCQAAVQAVQESLILILDQLRLMQAAVVAVVGELRLVQAVQVVVEAAAVQVVVDRLELQAQ
jgi:hypothetical protein